MPIGGIAEMHKSIFSLLALLAAASASAFECSETARAKARDFIGNEKQFHLGFLPTEQSNPITAVLVTEVSSAGGL